MIIWFLRTTNNVCKLIAKRLYIVVCILFFMRNKKAILIISIILIFCVTSAISFAIGLHIGANQQRASDEQITRILEYALNTPIIIHNTTENSLFNNTIGFEPILGTVKIDNVTFLDGYYTNISTVESDWEWD